MDTFWDGRKIVKGAFVPKRIVPLIEPGNVQVSPRKQRVTRKATSNVPVGWAIRDVDGFGEAFAVQFSENRKATSALKSAFALGLSARPKPGKDGSVRKVSEKMAIAAWRNARVMGKPSRGTARLDFLDLDLAARRQMRRAMLGRIKFA